MKVEARTLTILFVLIFLLISGKILLNSASMLQEPREETADPKTLDYNKAVTASSLEEKIRLLNAYLNKWSNSNYHKYVYAQLCLGYYQLKKFGQAVDNGKKALTYSDLEPDWRVQILLVMADSCASNPDRKDYKKALSYIDKAISIANANELTQLAEAGKRAKNAINKLINMGEFAKIKSLFDAKKYSEVISQINKLNESERNKFEIIKLYALSLYKLKKTDKALVNFKRAFTIKRTGEMANLIGIILYNKSKSNKKFLDESIKYFILASKLFAKEGNRKKSNTSLARAQSLFFNEKHQLDKKLKEIKEKYKGVEEKYNSLAKQYNDLLKKYEDKEDIPQDVEKKLDNMKKRLEKLEIKLEDKEIALEDFEIEQKKLIREFNQLLTKYNN